VTFAGAAFAAFGWSDSESDASLESEDSAVFAAVPLTCLAAGPLDSSESESDDSEDSSDEGVFLTALGFRFLKERELSGLSGCFLVGGNF
jgi:hypothetical protein